jgi:peptidyl-prolyl cis-trans isomerase C
MKIEMKRIFGAALIASLFSALSAPAATENAAPDMAPAAATSANSNAAPTDEMAKLFGDPVIAKGKGVEVKQSQLDQELLRIQTTLAAQGRTLSQDDLRSVKPRVLNDLITKQLLLSKATADDRAKGKAEFEKIVQQLKTAGKLTDEQFNQRLGRQLQLLNLTKAQWEKQSTDQTTALVVLKRELNVTATDAEAKEFYRTNSAEFEEPERVHARHILLLTVDPTTHTPLSDDQLKAKRKQMEDILKRARAGEDFAKLAEQYSEDPGSKDDGGDLPPFDKDGNFGGGRMDLAFTAAAFSLTNNQISDIVTTQYGYHIIQLLDKTPAHKLALTDKLPSSDMTVNEDIKNYLEQQKLAALAPAYLKKLSHDAAVDILDPSLKPAVTADESDAANLPAVPPAK